MNRAEEDYIKSIFQLHEKDTCSSENEQYVSNIRLSEYMGHTSQTVNESIRKLAQKDLLIYKPYKGCILTEKGRDAAIRLIRIHRLWEIFLVEKLGYSWEEVHRDAEDLEHTTSENLEKKLYFFLGEPRYCPHGNVIPDFEGNTGNRNIICLLDASPEKLYIIKKVSDDHQLLMYLNKKSISLEDVLMIKEKDEFSSLIKVIKDKREIVLGFNAASDIFVEEIK